MIRNDNEFNDRYTFTNIVMLFYNSLKRHDSMM